ncbi:nuclear transport factor 2 family protein [Gloeobacter kilaueensis]|uniref:SnoaL-like domain-containing protein n=1 Tax=Gloeobacter kilaueensis (strain ATCC BAA-2537 / CCAP 1431/1 / ULC 316 / JS1) TaxID=1183438 RepID=U5QE62_GLOK1|nr:nuclear transport factor 2 family protein [Gloeobacter kilaueensis]AGY57211.1 hypothetical protein GKIL_0965 [Gloeobacter kilaueensis JS1]
MPNPTAEHFMHTLQQIEQTRDVQPMVALFSDDSQLSNLAIEEPLRGTAGARQFWLGYLSAFRHVSTRFTRALEAKQVAVLEWVSEGALPDERPIHYRGVTIIEFEDDKVRNFRSYYDSAAFALY